MPRDLPVGNGEMLVAFDDLYRVRDLYWPHVGMPNHTCGHLQRFGVWVDGQFAWIEGPGWTRELDYAVDSLVTEVTLRNDRLGLAMRCRDAVDYWSPVYFRSVTVTDLAGRPRDVRLFFHQDLSIGESAIGDTVNYDPQTNGLVHYKDATYFLFNGCGPRGYGVDTWSTGQKRIRDAEGTWRDAEDGLLSQNAIAQGSVDSTVGFSLSLNPSGTAEVDYWICAGGSYEEVRELDGKIRSKSPRRMVLRTEAYWRLWANKEGFDFSPLPKAVRNLFMRSQLIVRTQIDKGGAIIAANDYDITRYAGDTYSYMWPRDGALVSYALTMAGQSELSRAFFRFAAKVVQKHGYFLHKYNPTGTLASSWHPWIVNGKPAHPIQQDETALVLWALRRHFCTFRDVEFVRDLYTPLVIEPANWLLLHRDQHGLPAPSWDLWEERHGVHLFTVAATIGALKAAAEFAHEVGALDRAADFEQGSIVMREAMIRYMWDPERCLFARMATADGSGSYALDFTLDASACGLFAFGALDATDPRVTAHMQALRKRLWVNTQIGGLARYERDPYHQVERHDLGTVPGNPWVISTLWYAQWVIETAHTIEELAEAVSLMQWACDRAQRSGVLAEQYDPYSGAHISVSPLTWSHAAFMTTALKYLQRHTRLTGVNHGVSARA
ncbi:MAG: glycoside hydrolase family 15 protein [Phycisphaerales bacterium]|nr:glycoside hydrolase family 15 protein [Phycisphaerales bacterium]